MHELFFSGTHGIVDYTNYDDMKYAVSFYALVNFWFCSLAHSKPA